MKTIRSRPLSTRRLAWMALGAVVAAHSLCVQAEPPDLYQAVAARYGLSADALYAQAVHYAGRQSRFASSPTPWPWTVRLCQQSQCETVFADDRATLAAVLVAASRAGLTLYVGPLGLPWSPRSKLPLLAATAPRVTVNAAVQQWVLTQRTMTVITPSEAERVRGAAMRTARARFWRPLIDRVAREEGVDPVLIQAMVAAESAYDPTAVSPKGAAGFMQLMPDTAERFGLPRQRRTEPEPNLRAGARYLRWLLDYFHQDRRLALAGYNAGEGAVLKYGNQIPPYRETQAYVERVQRVFAAGDHR